MTPRTGRYGAPLGATNYMEEDAGPLFLQRVRMVGGDYAADGTYWGGGCGTTPLWCAFTYPAAEARIYIRAYSRAQAEEKLKEDFPAAVLRKSAYTQRRTTCSAT